MAKKILLYFMVVITHAGTGGLHSTTTLGADGIHITKDHGDTGHHDYSHSAHGGGHGNSYGHGNGHPGIGYGHGGSGYGHDVGFAGAHGRDVGHGFSAGHHGGLGKGGVYGAHGEGIGAGLGYGGAQGGGLGYGGHGDGGFGVGVAAGATAGAAAAAAHGHGRNDVFGESGSAVAKVANDMLGEQVHAAIANGAQTAKVLMNDLAKSNSLNNGSARRLQEAAAKGSADAMHELENMAAAGSFAAQSAVDDLKALGGVNAALNDASRLKVAGASDNEVAAANAAATAANAMQNAAKHINAAINEPGAAGAAAAGAAAAAHGGAGAAAAAHGGVGAAAAAHGGNLGINVDHNALAQKEFEKAGAALETAKMANATAKVNNDAAEISDRIAGHFTPEIQAALNAGIGNHESIEDIKKRLAFNDPVIADAIKKNEFAVDEAIKNVAYGPDNAAAMQKTNILNTLANEGRRHAAGGGAAGAVAAGAGAAGSPYVAGVDEYGNVFTQANANAGDLLNLGLGGRGEEEGVPVSKDGFGVGGVKNGVDKNGNVYVGFDSRGNNVNAAGVNAEGLAVDAAGNPVLNGQVVPASDANKIREANALQSASGGPSTLAMVDADKVDPEYKKAIETQEMASEAYNKPSPDEHRMSDEEVNFRKASEDALRMGATPREAEEIGNKAAVETAMAKEAAVDSMLKKQEVEDAEALLKDPDAVAKTMKDIKDRAGGIQPAPSVIKNAHDALNEQEELKHAEAVKGGQITGDVHDKLHEKELKQAAKDLDDLNALKKAEEIEGSKELGELAAKKMAAEEANNMSEDVKNFNALKRADEIKEKHEVLNAAEDIKNFNTLKKAEELKEAHNAINELEDIKNMENIKKEKEIEHAREALAREEDIAKLEAGKNIGDLPSAHEVMNAAENMKNVDMMHKEAEMKKAHDAMAAAEKLKDDELQGEVQDAKEALNAAENLRGPTAAAEVKKAQDRLQAANENKAAFEVEKAAEQVKRAKDVLEAAEENKAVHDAENAAQKVKRAEDALALAESNKTLDDLAHAAEELKAADEVQQAKHENDIINAAEDVKKAQENLHAAEQAKKLNDLANKAAAIENQKTLNDLEFAQNVHENDHRALRDKMDAEMAEAQKEAKVEELHKQMHPDLANKINELAKAGELKQLEQDLINSGMSPEGAKAEVKAQKQKMDDSDKKEALMNEGLSPREAEKVLKTEPLNKVTEAHEVQNLVKAGMPLAQAESVAAANSVARQQAQHEENEVMNAAQQKMEEKNYHDLAKENAAEEQKNLSDLEKKRFMDEAMDKIDKKAEDIADLMVRKGITPAEANEILDGVDDAKKDISKQAEKAAQVALNEMKAVAENAAALIESGLKNKINAETAAIAASKQFEEIASKTAAAIDSGNLEAIQRNIAEGKKHGEAIKEAIKAKEKEGMEAFEEVSELVKSGMSRENAEKLVGKNIVGATQIDKKRQEEIKDLIKSGVSAAEAEKIYKDENLHLHKDMEEIAKKSLSKNETKEEFKKLLDNMRKQEIKDIADLVKGGMSVAEANKKVQGLHTDEMNKTKNEADMLVKSGVSESEAIKLAGMNTTQNMAKEQQEIAEAIKSGNNAEEAVKKAQLNEAVRNREEMKEIEDQIRSGASANQIAQGMKDKNVKAAAAQLSAAMMASASQAGTEEMLTAGAAMGAKEAQLGMKKLKAAEKSAAEMQTYAEQAEKSVENAIAAGEKTNEIEKKMVAAEKAKNEAIKAAENVVETAGELLVNGVTSPALEANRIKEQEDMMARATGVATKHEDNLLSIIDPELASYAMTKQGLKENADAQPPLINSETQPSNLKGEIPLKDKVLGEKAEPLNQFEAAAKMAGDVTQQAEGLDKDMELAKIERNKRLDDTMLSPTKMANREKSDAELDNEHNLNEAKIMNDPSLSAIQKEKAKLDNDRQFKEEAALNNIIKSNNEAAQKKIDLANKIEATKLINDVVRAGEEKALSDIEKANILAKANVLNSENLADKKAEIKGIEEEKQKLVEMLNENITPEKEKQEIKDQIKKMNERENAGVTDAEKTILMAELKKKAPLTNEEKIDALVGRAKEKAEDNKIQKLIDAEKNAGVSQLAGYDQNVLSNPEKKALIDLEKQMANEDAKSGGKSVKPGVHPVGEIENAIKDLVKQQEAGEKEIMGNPKLSKVDKDNQLMDLNKNTRDAIKSQGEKIPDAEMEKKLNDKMNAEDKLISSGPEGLDDKEKKIIENERNGVLAELAVLGGAGLTPEEKALARMELDSRILADKKGGSPFTREDEDEEKMAIKDRVSKAIEAGVLPSNLEGVPLNPDEEEKQILKNVDDVMNTNDLKKLAGLDLELAKKELAREHDVAKQLSQPKKAGEDLKSPSVSELLRPDPLVADTDLEEDQIAKRVRRNLLQEAELKDKDILDGIDDLKDAEREEHALEKERIRLLEEANALEKENIKLRKEENQIAAEAAFKKALKKPTPENLGVIGIVPDDADKVSIKNAQIKLPLKSFTGEKPKNSGEVAALNASNNLADQLRNRITKEKVPSKLNAIEGDDGVYNVPESGKYVQIDQGEVLFGSDAKDNMAKRGSPTDGLTYKTNIGETPIVNVGEGYYVADASGMRLPLTSPTSKNPPKVLSGNNKTLDVTDGLAIAIKSGSAVMTPMKDFHEKMHPTVYKKSNVAPVEPEPVRAAKNKLDNELKKRLDVNVQTVKVGDNQGSSVLTPAIGVQQVIDVKNPLLSGTSKIKTTDNGQDGIGTATDEEKEEAPRSLNNSPGMEHLENDDDAVIKKKIQEMAGREGIIKPKNAFNRAANANKKAYIEKIPEDVEEQDVNALEQEDNQFEQAAVLNERKGEKMGLTKGNITAYENTKAGVPKSRKEKKIAIKKEKDEKGFVVKGVNKRKVNVNSNLRGSAGLEKLKSEIVNAYGDSRCNDCENNPIKAMPCVMNSHSAQMARTLRMNESEFAAHYVAIPKESMSVFFRYQSEHKNPKYMKEYANAYNSLTNIYRDKAPAMIKLLGGAMDIAKKRCRPIKLSRLKNSKIVLHRNQIPLHLEDKNTKKKIQQMERIIEKAHGDEKIKTPVARISVKRDSGTKKGKYNTIRNIVYADNRPGNAPTPKVKYYAQISDKSPNKKTKRKGRRRQKKRGNI